MQQKSQLKDGSEWIDHEDCLIGNDVGLRNLIKACEIALEDGSYYGNDLGDYVAVKKLASNWFTEPMYSSQTRYQNYGIVAFFIAMIMLVFIGFGTVIYWLFG